MKQLPAGQGRDHMCLFDNQWRLIWDSATATTPAYQHIANWVHAVIDHADGTRWVGQLYRCAEGVRRWSMEDLSRVLVWPNPILEAM
ncbi:hypothetical protein [Mycobacterium sp. PSTR-4-N]|uniref:hypothetical protein n=1 Tax=Mycobacterium sp. PSTR-4-N TaxID=2917745 RepID=UPI001F1562C5|nr:hypothetical protein [Mycobacterium sp. PSTR-4-N]MCG7596332.1 hypothetical protein [Mycobacterium sp. PSTR-4-N]